MSLTPKDLLRWRLHAQHLIAGPLPGPVQVVEHLVAVQAQDFLPAQWSLGRRSDHDAAAVAAAFEAGQYLRTHVLRPTWHLVAPVDLGWLLALTTPRVHQVNSAPYRRHGLNPTLRQRCADVVVDALQNRPRTRAELQAKLETAGIKLSGQGLAYAMMHIELEALVASGPMRGRQHTYVLLEDPGTCEDRDEGLAELAARFVTGRGPSTEEDLAGWANLTLADARRAVHLAGDRIERVACEDREFLVGAGSEPPPATSTPLVHLLQPYDEHVLYGGGLFDADGAARRAWHAGQSPYNALVALDGAFAGWWRRTTRRYDVLVDVVLGKQLNERQIAALEAESDRLGDHLGLTAALQVRGPQPGQGSCPDL